MNVLLIGQGGREHALAWALSASPLLERLYAAPGNAGIAEVADIVPVRVSDHVAVARFCREKAVDLVVVGPEAPLAAGIVDDLMAEGIRAFGPTRAAARLESSKGFTKALCAEHGIPTAAFARFTEPEPARAHVRAQGAPIVVKADGLAAGKGVTVATTLNEALEAVDACFSGAFGAAGEAVVIEEFLEGDEASYFALVDGETVLALTSAQDHKRAYDGDRGPNTGGMGAYSPAPVLTPELTERVLGEIMEPTVRALGAQGTPYRGVLYAGLMITAEGPKLIEYNVRFGDPEAQVLVMRLEDDLLLLMQAACDGVLGGMTARWRAETALTVVMAAEGYPGAYAKGTEIRNLEAAQRIEGVEIFHAGTRRDGNRLMADGGRVLNVTALGRTVAEARERAYRAAALIDWPEGFYRRDIGRRAIEEAAR